jgi:hypothetical protein
LLRKESEADPSGHWRAYWYESILQRDKVSLEISWITDESLKDTSSLPDPDAIAAELVEDLRCPDRVPGDPGQSDRGPDG